MLLGVVPHQFEVRLEVVAAERLGAEGAVLVGELGHLGEADLVDLLRRLVGGGEVAQGRGVRLVASGEPREPAPLLGPRVRKGLAQRVAERLESGSDRALDGGPQLGAQGVGVDPVGHLHRGDGGIILDGAGEQPVELLQGLGDRELGRHPPVGGGLTRAHSQLLEVLPHSVELGGHLLGDGCVGHGQQAEDQGELPLRPAHRVGRQTGQRCGGQVRGGGRRSDQGLAGEPPVVVQHALVDRVRPRHEAAQLGDAAILGLAADVLPLADRCVVTEHVPVRRLEAERGVPVLVGQLIEVVAHETSFRRAGVGRAQPSAALARRS